jgi:3-methyladenine DNA glycosylase AlkD
MTFTKDFITQMYQARNPEEAIPMEKYMKNKFLYLGIKTELRRTILKKKLVQYPDEIKQNFRTIALELFQEEYREFHQCAIDIVLANIKKKWQITDQFFIEQLLLQHSWWDSVDTLAKYGIGGYLKQFPSEKYELIERFSNSNNLWLKRTAIIFQLGYKLDTDFELLKAECLKNIDSKEFFIQKAIGWALRDYASVNPQGVLKFVQNNPFKPLSVKEALRKII